MKKLPVLMVGLAVIVASCAPFRAPNRLTESLTPTAPPTLPTEAQEPTATAEVQAPTATTEAQEPTATAEAQEATATQVLDEGDVIAPAPSGKSFQPQLGQADINLDEVVTLLPPDAIPALLPDSVPQIMVSAAEADASGIENGVQVIGVSINGESRAYPIPFLSRHEIVNDTVGGRHIAATW